MPISNPILPKKYFSKYRRPLAEFPSLIRMQLDSFKWLVEQGLKEVFFEFSPISDYSDKKFKLEFLSLSLAEPKYDEHYAKLNKLSYDGTLNAKIRLTNKTLGTAKEQELFLTDLPLMTPHGTFVVNGVERVIVPQLVRSSGVFFSEREVRGRRYIGASVIPARGVWIEIDFDVDDMIYVRIDRKRKFPVTSLLRVFGLTSDEAIKKAFSTSPEAGRILEACLERDTHKEPGETYVEVYKRLRDGDLATPENAREFVKGLFGPERYDFSAAGRFRFNQRFGKSLEAKELERRTLSADDLVTIISHIIRLQLSGGKADDVDHLGSRRVRFVGELLQQRVRLSMTQIKRNVQDRMSTVDASTTLPVQILNQRPLQARVKEFFTQNQLSQVRDPENILAELEHLRQLSAMGPGGLTRERATLEVRDVHTSHYGRICPIHTPEGPNIGLVLHLSTYARTNQFGIIETPYIKVKNGQVTGEIVYLNASDEERYTIAHAGTPRDERGKIIPERVEARVGAEPGFVERGKVDFIDVATHQAFSVATSMIPFLEHNDANRALMGSNMQKQATPCVLPEAPLVATGIEALVAADSGRLVTTEENGTVLSADARRVIVRGNHGDRTYNLVNFSRTNNFSCFHQRPAVSAGDKVKKGDVLADTSSSVGGQMALGQNILVAFMSWSGANYEDAVVLSERLVKDGKFSSIHVEEFVCTVRDTKLGPEITTRDIPNVGESKLKDLDEEGIVRMGAEVKENDILVGKITPKGETELTPEERLLRSIFAEKARDVKDSSLRLEHGKRGRVVSVKIFSRDKGHALESGVIKKVAIEVAQLRNISVGDKLAGRHGNKGVISYILPEEEMPFMADGTPVDAILTPLGVPSRMNLGQILEMHLGLAANTLGYQAVVPPFGGASVDEIKAELKAANFPEHGRLRLFDGRTGEPFHQEVAVGIMYILKLRHMVEDKIHMRSTGPYSLITQQPLGGKAQGGGQRFGEMEVWALEGYGAAHTLREMLTIKSDDITGRSQVFDAIIRGEDIKPPGVPASFKVLLNYLRGLALNVELIKKSRSRK